MGTSDLPKISGSQATWMVFPGLDMVLFAEE